MVLSSFREHALARAIERADKRNISCQETHRVQNGADVIQLFEVGSFSRPGKLHKVMLHYSAAGIEFSCTCEGFERGLLCQHVAAALKLDGISPIPEEPEPAPRRPNLIEPEPGTHAVGAAPQLPTSWWFARLRGQ